MPKPKPLSFFHSLRAEEYVIQEHVVSTNKDQIRGRIKEAKGKLKEVAGKLLGNERLQTKGKAQKSLGKAQAKFGDVKQQRAEIPGAARYRASITACCASFVVHRSAN